jgi:hypothetical protein
MLVGENCAQQVILALKGETLTNGLIKLSEVLVMRMRRGRGLDSSAQDMEKPPTEMPQEID